MDENDFKLKYNHCKKRIKQWEAEFKKTNGKIPQKHDIKEASPKIREYYKIYWNLKNILLEEQILGTAFSEDRNLDCFETKSVLSDHKPSIESERNCDCCDTKSLKNADNKNNESFKTSPKETNLPELQRLSEGKNIFRSISSFSSDKKSGPDSDKNLELECDSNLKGNQCFDKIIKNKSTGKTSKLQKKPEGKTWLKSVSSKLFEGSSFQKRNPRKAVAKKNNSLSSSLMSDPFGTSFVSDVSFASTGDISFQSCASPLPHDLTDGPSFSVEKEVSPRIKSLIASPASLTPLFSSAKVNIVTPSAGTSAFSVGLLGAVSSQSKPKSVRKLDVGWVERCKERAEKSLETSVSCDSGFESVGNSLSSPTNETFPIATTEEQNDEHCSEDDLIYDSDDENSRQLVLSLKRKSSALSPSSTEEAATEVTKKAKVDDNGERKVAANPAILMRPLSSKKPPVAKHVESKATLVKREILQNKIKAGTINENFVKLNLRKKVFVRGKRNFNYSNYKKKEWKRKKKEASYEGAETGGILRCFKCGDVGHYARKCMAAKEDKLLPVDDLIDDDPGLPTLEEAQEMAKATAVFLPVRRGTTLKLPEPAALPSDLPELDGVPQVERKSSVYPLRSSQEQVYSVLKEFGHESFRPGQEEAVMRILDGKSTLLMLSTGGGKSLCYQLPAYIYHKTTPSIALVVSPLVSLMDDQVSGTSSFMNIACLHANLSEKQRGKVVEQLQAGELSALLVSPEAIVSSDNFGFGSIIKHLPPISFACIDEVHCVSQWSFNFRPSYLMLTKVLREKFGVSTFLGLTATASKSTVESIVKELGIDGSEGVIQDTPCPSHLNLAVSKVAEKDDALLHLIRNSGGGATLVYCTRREECARLATLIRTVLRDVTAQPYHAGLPASKRKSVQRLFMQGKLQVVVATVAFGMGINKQDIRCVFHYNMPKDWESYVQEVGRAGRDGHPANCHVLLDPRGDDLQELRRHVLSNAVDRHMVRRLLDRVFQPCDCSVGSCTGHEVAFSITDAVQAIDLPEENIATLLCYLELHSDRLVQVLSPCYMTCKVQSYHGAKGIHKAARDCPPLAVAAAQAEGGSTASSFSFDVIELARQIAWDSGTVKRHLKQTEWKKDKSGAWRRSGIHVQFSDLGLRVRSRGDLSPEQLDEALEYLINRVNDHQTKALNLLQRVYSAFSYFKTDLKSEKVGSKSEEIKSVIRTYFETETIPSHIPLIKVQEDNFDEEYLAAEVRHLVCSYRDNTFNGRAVARIFYGIQSPNYPASMWFKARQWRAHLDKPFEKILQIATREILRLK